MHHTYNGALILKWSKYLQWPGLTQETAETQRGKLICKEPVGDWKQPRFHSLSALKTCLWGKARSVQWTLQLIFLASLLPSPSSGNCVQLLCSVVSATHFNAITSVCLSPSPKPSALFPWICDHTFPSFSLKCVKSINYISISCRTFPWATGGKNVICSTSSKKQGLLPRGADTFAPWPVLWSPLLQLMPLWLRGWCPKCLLTHYIWLYSYNQCLIQHHANLM